MPGGGCKAPLILTQMSSGVMFDDVEEVAAVLLSRKGYQEESALF